MFKQRREKCRSMSKSSMKHRIERFHVVDEQWKSKKCTVLKSVMHVQVSCFAHKNNCFLTLLLLLSLSSLIHLELYWAMAL